MSNNDLSWVDLRLSGIDDPDAAAMMTALGVDPTATIAAVRSGQGTDFQLGERQIQGTAWLAGAPSEAPVLARFAYDAHRLVTIRTAGDEAFAEVQSMLATRADLAIKQPSRVLGFVLQAMQSTLQDSLTKMSIEVSLLDLDVIATSVPQKSQAQELFTFRTSVVPFAARFPSYVVNVTSALVDPDTISVIDQAGVTELQNFSNVVGNTGGMLQSLIDSLRNTVQDIQGQVSNWQGQRINQLTVVTFIFLPITFLTGYFGMNFNWLDNWLNGAGEYIALGVVLPILMVAFSIVSLSKRGFSVSLKNRTKPTTATPPT